MKIALKCNFFNRSEIELETQSATLAALLDELSKNQELTTIEFFDSESGELYPDCELLLNGQSYQLLNQGLDTKLKDDDEIELIMFTLAGG